MAGIVGLTEIQHQNGTSALSVGSDGKILSSVAAVAFRYALSANQSIASGGWHLASMNKAIISNSDYNTSTYRYTVPANHAGIYMFSLQTNWLTAGDFNNNQVALYKNGVKIGQHQARQEHYENQNLVTIESVSAGDYFQMYVNQESGSAVDLRAADEQCWFSGVRIGL